MAGTGAASETITTARGNDTFNIEAAADPLSISTGPGNSTFNVGSLMPTSRGTLDGIVGPLTLNPGAGTNTLNVDDSGDMKSRAATLSATNLIGMGLGAGIRYQNMASLNVRMGQANDTFALNGLSPSTTSVTIDGGAGDNTLSAQIAGDFTSSLTLLDFSEITSFTIGGDLSGQVTVLSPNLRVEPNGQIDSMLIHGSLSTTGVIQAPAIESLEIVGNLSGTVSETSPTATGSLYVDSGSITTTGKVSWVGTLENLDVRQNVAGQIQAFTTVKNISIGDSLTSTGTITAGNVNDLAIEGILAGKVAVSGSLDKLTVGKDLAGIYSAGQLGTVVVSGLVVSNSPPPVVAGPTQLLTPPPSVSPVVTLAKVHEILNAKHQVTKILVTFSGAVNAAVADETSTYRLATRGSRRSYAARNSGLIRLKNAALERASNTVTLTPKKPFTLAKPVQLSILGTGEARLHDSYGRLIDGDNNGQPGGNAVAILSGFGATVNAAVVTSSASETGQPSVRVNHVARRTIGGPLATRKAMSRKSGPIVPLGRDRHDR